MTADYKILSGMRSLPDYMRAEREWALKKQSADVEAKKALQLDVDKLGERAFMKAAMGQELTPQELAAAQFIDAKSGGMQWNPVTGEMYQKPRISDKIGLPGVKTGNIPADMPNYSTPFVPAGDMDLSQFTPVSDAQLNGYVPGNTAPPSPPSMGPVNEYDALYQQSLAAAKGNPKLEQQIKADYLKSKMDFNESQAKAAGFADRMNISNPIIGDVNKQKAGQSLVQKGLDAIPILGNFVVSDDYQSFNQAQRDFINAQLRRESGAVISPEEFANAREQYFPQPGDSEQVILQKAKNRQEAVSAMARSAGPGYKAANIRPPDMKQRAQKEFDKKKGKTAPDDVQSLIDMYSQ